MALPEPPSSLDERTALREELKSLHDDGKFNEDVRDLQELRRRIHALPPHEKIIGLALSGGGIRSATFSLGVLQGLAHRGWLQKFHYLSTVSGGGYIGGWLSAWIARAGFSEVLADLKGAAQTQGANPGAIRYLRGYSNYLSPVWGVSLDAVTLVATYVRNLLINWLVLIPLLAALALWPRLNVAAINGLDVSFSTGWLLVVALALLVSVPIAYATSDLPGPHGHRPAKNLFYAWFVAPLLAAAVFASWLWAWLAQSFASPPEGRTWILFALAGAGVHSVGVMVGLIVRRWRSSATPDAAAEARPKRNLAWDALVVLGAGAIGGLVCYWGARRLFPQQWLAADPAGAYSNLQLYATVSAPFLLGAFAIAGVGFAALTRKTRTEADREWWSRAGGFLILAAAGWIALHVLVIYAPQWISQIVKRDSLLPAAAGGAAGLLGAAAGYWGRNGARIKDQAARWAARLGMRTLDLLCAAFIAALFAGLSLLASALFDRASSALSSNAEQVANHFTTALQNTGPLIVLSCLAALVGFAVVVSSIIGVNAFSMHAMYGNRLVRAYLGASNRTRKPHPFTGFDAADNVKMHDLAQGRRLLHVVNLAINIVRPSADNLAWQERKAASFTVTRLHSGSPALGFRNSRDYANSISLGRAMTISGAAAAPNMGYHSSPLVTFVMALFNVRLGWWLPNPGPAGESAWRLDEPRRGLGSLISEALSGTTSDKEFVYLSDGGHFENLGLYELVRRRCHLIVAVDAGCDPDYEFEDLQNAIRKIRIDLGVPIDFPVDSLPTPQLAARTGRHFAIGTIGYSAVDGPGEPDRFDGRIIYIKPVLSGDEPLDVAGYAQIHQGKKQQFPQQPTSDQFFDESQFESYRSLGYHSVMNDGFPDDADVLAQQAEDAPSDTDRVR